MDLPSDGIFITIAWGEPQIIDIGVHLGCIPYRVSHLSTRATTPYLTQQNWTLDFTADYGGKDWYSYGG